MKRSYWIVWFIGLLCLFGVLAGFGDDGRDLLDDVKYTVEDTLEDVGESFDDVVDDVGEVFADEDEETGVFTTTFPTEPVMVTVAARSGSMAEAILAVKDQWEAQTGHTVMVVELPYNYLQQKIFTDVLTGIGHYDLVHIDDPWLPALAHGGHLVPLSEFNYQIDTDFMPLSLDVASWPPPTGPRLPSESLINNPPELFALPFIGNVQLVWYRKDLITNEPATLQELMTAVQEQTSANPAMYGYAYRSGWGNPIVTEFNAWNWAYGGDIFDEDWNVIINQPASVQALTDFIAFTSSVDAQGYDSTGSIISQVLNGEAMMAIVWPNYNPQIAESGKESEIGVIPFPQVSLQTSQLGNWLLGIPVTAGHKQEAFDFLTWLTSEDIMKELALLGSPPVRRSIFDDPDLQQTFWWYPAMEIALDNATWRPRTPEWNKIEKILGNHLVQAVQSQTSPQEALDRAANEIEAVLRQAGYNNRPERPGRGP